ncbi:hypothetical protein Vretifemale_17173 [Volvox reticuliferus]|uniref:Uncharacterized protein n=1 Tax=Volvox reticuliferus TaxID=1737510 RepID=A0A8J4CV06_9CHLO|nr:hypothetical protein Vretifemale_17173 [Volvox reticuliferus]
MYEEIPLDVSAGYPPIIYPLAAQNGQFSKYPAPGQATGMASAGGHCRHSRSILCAPSIVRQRVVGDNTYSTGIVGVSDWRSRGNGDPGSDKWNGISSNGEGRGSGTRVRAMPVAKLRQQWQEQQEQQRQGRLPSRMEHQQLPAGRLQQQQQPVAGAGWHEESRGSRWYEEVCTVVRSTDGPSMGMAIADVTCTSASPMTLYGYAERGASSSPSRYPGFSLPKRDQSGTVTYMATFWGDASEGGATAPRRQSPSIADVASTTAAAVAAAAANISTLLATASSALGKRPISTGRGHRNHIPPPQQRKPIYAPDLGPAFESRMPIFRNVTNMRQVDRKGSRQPAAIAVAGALGPCTSGTCTVNPPFLLSGHGNFRDLDGAGAGHITDGAADGDPDCRSRISAHLPEQTRPSAERKSSAVNRKSSNDVCRGPLVYDMLNQVDMHMPDMRSQRPRSAAAVMGRSKRGLDEAPQTLDARYSTRAVKSASPLVAGCLSTLSPAAPPA